MKSHFFNLMLMHQRLDDRLQQERVRRWPDVMRIQQLKKLKLAIKDRMTRLQLQPAMNRAR
jgi:uncharacterized protein